MSIAGISSEEEAYLDVVNMKFPGGFILFDVGASLGSYTEMVRERSMKHVVAHLFEPRSRAYGKLVKKYRDDNLTVLNNVALGYRETRTMMRICSDPEHSYIPIGIDVGPSENVDVITLDDYLENTALHHFGVYLKIDTEGFEMEVLIGAQKALSTTVSAVQFEYGGTWERRPWRLREVKRVLKGFQIFEYREGSVTELQDFTDHYSYTNYLALRQ